MYYMDEVDWTHTIEHVEDRRARYGRVRETDILIAWAEEALRDPDAVIYQPDPTSRTGRSDRTIGWSPSAGFIVTVITVRHEGKTWGATAWRSSEKDQRRYNEGNE